MPPKRSTTPMTDDAINQLIAQGVADALAECEANRGNGNGDDSHDSRTGERRRVPTTRECTYSDFLKCQPLNFKGTEGFNSHVKTVSHEATYGMTWKTLKKMMTDKYCPRGEIKKLEIELWNLKIKGTDVVSYTQRFQELALIYGRMFPEESDEVEKYVGGLPDNIQGSVMASKPKTMQDAIEIANELIDQKHEILAGSLEEIPSSHKAKIKYLYTSESKIQEKIKSQAEKCKRAPHLPFVRRTSPQSQKN
ncbi:reverse transcriptase domain-containing protein [Tanacetum coccineum]|uniref:Reverse transcriptase domain-containing protein n=1 Tax=Tanacetum coccineum TaxID=301880 RepID=A0ABQ4ZQH8_9ASTR